MRVTIGGPPGSGTTTVAKIVSKKLQYTHVYTGDIFRNLAKEKNMSLEDFSKLAEKDFSIDMEVDRRQKELGANDNIILEGGGCHASRVHNSASQYVPGKPQGHYG